LELGYFGAKVLSVRCIYLCAKWCQQCSLHSVEW